MVKNITAGKTKPTTPFLEWWVPFHFTTLRYSGTFRIAPVLAEVT
jgi:hypothetical protein